MDLTSAKHDTPDDDIDRFRKKLQEEIQKIMDSTIVIGPTMDLSHLPHPLPPFKPDDINLEKLEWIMPPIPVKPEDYIPEVNLDELEKLADKCRKEINNDTRNQKE